MFWLLQDTEFLCADDVCLVRPRTGEAIVRLSQLCVDAARGRPIALREHACVESERHLRGGLTGSLGIVEFVAGSFPDLQCAWQILLHEPTTNCECCLQGCADNTRTGTMKVGEHESWPKSLTVPEL